MRRQYGSRLHSSGLAPEHGLAGTFGGVRGNQPFPLWQPIHWLSPTRLPFLSACRATSAVGRATPRAPARAMCQRPATPECALRTTTGDKYCGLEAATASARATLWILPRSTVVRRGGCRIPAKSWHFVERVSRCSGRYFSFQLSQVQGSSCFSRGWDNR